MTRYSKLIAVLDWSALTLTLVAAALWIGANVTGFFINLWSYI